MGRVPWSGGNGALLLHPWVGQARPGSGGHSPPSASMARLISASGEWNPNAIRVSSRSLVLIDSTSPLDRPYSRLAWMPSRCSLIDRASLTNAGCGSAGPRKPGVQQRDRAGALELEHQPQFLLEQIGPVQSAVNVGDAGEGAALADGEVFWVLPQREPGTLELSGQCRLAAAAGGVPGLAADLVQRVGGPADDVEGVQAQHGLGAAAGERVGDPGGRIRADQAELGRAVLAERVEEAVQRGLVMAGRGPDQPAGVVVDHHRQVAVALAVGDLVDADAPQPSRRSTPGSASSATRVRIRPTVRQATRSSSATAAWEVWTASHAAVSSKLGVNPAPCRAQGTAATTTPWWRQRTLGASASNNAGTVPRSSAVQRRRPSP
jgi:hypothetical protein